MQDIVVYIPALILLLLFSAFFSGTEAAFYSLTRSQLHSLRNSSSGRAVARLLHEPRKLLISILLGNLVVNIFTTSAATALFIGIFGERGVGISFVLMSILIMAFGEIFPKAIALHWSERFATLAVYPVRVFHTLVWPLRFPLNLLSNSVIDLLRRRLGHAAKSFTWEELLTALRIGRGQGTLGQFEFEVLSNVISFREKIVREIMTPSIDVISVPVTSTRARLIDVFARTGHSRVPVSGDSTDDIIGVLHVKDLIDPLAASDEKELRACLHEPYFVQEATSINALYSDLQERRQHMAIVLDEYTSFAGIVTVEDILEELVGEIRDARDSKARPYMSLDEDRIVVQGAMEIDDFNEVFGVSIEDEEHDTVAGYVIGLTGRIPREGETIVAEDVGLRFHIISSQPNRIRKMRVERA